LQERLAAEPAQSMAGGTDIQADTLSIAGVDQSFPNLRRGWSKTLGGPIMVGAKWSLLSESRGDRMSLAPRVAFEFGGVEWAGTNSLVTHVDLAGSKEFHKAVELAMMFGGRLRENSDAFNETNGLEWGLGGIFGSRSRNVSGPMSSTIRSFSQSSSSEVEGFFFIPGTSRIS